MPTHRHPVTDLSGHLMWTRHGTVWATWRIHGLAYNGTIEDKRAVAGLHRLLIRSLTGEALFLSSIVPEDPVSVIDRMIAGLDLVQIPAWVDECEATLDEFLQIPVGQRHFWLSVPLANTGQRRLAEPARSAWRRLKDTLDLPATRPVTTEQQARLVQARQIQDLIPAPFRPTPVTPAEHVWILNHATRRGQLDLPVPTGTDLSADLLTPSSGSIVSSPILDEGAVTDLDAPTRANVLQQRILKVTDHAAGDVHGLAPSYQAVMAVSEVPAGGMRFPGSEWLHSLDQSGIDADWAIRTRTNPRDKVLARNRKAVRQLNEQFDQREAEVTTGLHDLNLAADLLAEYQAIFANDKLEVEVEHTMLVAVSAARSNDTQTDAEVNALAQDQAIHLAKLMYDAAGIKLERVPGHAEELWWAMQPGTPRSQLIQTYAHFTSSGNFSRLVPFIDHRLGGSNGPVLAVSLSTSRPRPVHVDLAGYPELDMSGSVLAVAELGAGKALAIDTPIPTPNGWTEMGSLNVGDMVYDETGQPTKVLATSPVMTGRRVFDVVFSDGSVITADADHLWTTVPLTHRQRAAKKAYERRAKGLAVSATALLEHTHQITGPGWWESAVTNTTAGLAESLRANGQLNHAIPVAQPLHAPDSTLPIHPYVLGAWLGDGSSRNSQITTVDPEILTFIEAAGYHVRPLKTPLQYQISIPAEPRQPLPDRTCPCGTTFTPRYRHRRFCSRDCATMARGSGAPPAPISSCESCGTQLQLHSTGRRCRPCQRQATLAGRLRGLGLRLNKHIPTQYLRASITQRRALLAGLLDTDGTVTPNGSVEYTSTNRVLAQDVRELAASLGLRPTLRHRPARLNGRDCGTAYTVAFTTLQDVFWLSRKTAVHVERRRCDTPARLAFRYISEIREVPSVPVRCIAVEAPSRLFLAGEAMIPTHNSVFQKTVCSHLVDQGGQFWAIDKSEDGEWARFAASFDSHLVVDPTDPTCSMDPLRILPLDDGADVARSFLIQLLNLDSQDELGLQLAQVLEPDHMRQHNISSLLDVITHLDTLTPTGARPRPRASSRPAGQRTRPRTPEGGPPTDTQQNHPARHLATRLRSWASTPIGRIVFDATLPPADLTVSATAWRTHGMEQPNADDLRHAHLFRQLPPEKIFGRAYYRMLTGLARRLTFADRSRPAAFVSDELYDLTQNPENTRDVQHIVRRGRRPKALFIAGTHDIGDLDDEVLAGLIPTRVLMRHRDPGLATRGLRWLGITEEDPDFTNHLKTVTTDLSPVHGEAGVPAERRGEAYIRDAFGNFGPCRILPPARAQRRAAVLTTPPRSTVRT